MLRPVLQSFPEAAERVGAGPGRLRHEPGEVLPGGGEYLLLRADAARDRERVGVPRQEAAGLGHEDPGPGAGLPRGLHVRE